MEAKARATRRRVKKQFLVDEKGRRTGVILSMREYERLMEAAEDLTDLQAADEARAAGGKPVPLEELEKRLRAEGKLR